MIRKALLYAAAITALLYLVRYWHYNNLLMQKQGYYAKLRQAFLEPGDYDVLFLGSSRVEMHYDTRLFDSLTQRNSFNLGLAGATPPLAWAALKAYLSGHTAPRLVIYEVDYHALNVGNEIKDFNNYFPVLRNPVLRQELNRIDPRMQHFYYNPYYSWPFTGIKNLSTGLRNRLGLPGLTDSLYYKGFEREVLRPALHYTPAPPYSSWLNATNRAALDSITLYCRKKNIHVVWVSSPMFGGGRIGLQNKPAILKQLHDMARRGGLEYYDLSSLPFCARRDLFVDHYHMNYAGARLFTARLAAIVNNKSKNNSLK